LYLGSGEEAVFGLLNPADPGVASRVPILICPPFGFEEICSYRARWAWAQKLAAQGHDVLRIDLPGTGDSPGGPRDPARVQAWTDALGAAARWLAGHAQTDSVVALGIGLGGLLACRAAADGAPIDALALWAVPSSGRKLTRVLRAFSKLETAESGTQGDVAPEGSLVSGGYLLSAETLADLGKLDVKTLAWAGTRPRHALLLGREQTPSDTALRTALQEAGATVAEENGTGYSLMMSEPHPSKPLPLEAFVAVDLWLEDLERTPATGAPAAAAVVRHPAVELDGPGGTTFRERPFTVAQSFGTLSGVITEPLPPPGTAATTDGLCVVMLNAGAQRRTGPNRMWVESARRWAQLGVASARVDLSNIGESADDGRHWEDVVGLTDPIYLDEVRDTVNALVEQGVGRRFILMGLCSGAYWSFQVAMDDDRIDSAFMLNPGTLVWSRYQVTARQGRRLVKLGRVRAWRRLLTGDIPAADLRQFTHQTAEWIGLTVRGLPARLRRRKVRGPEGDEVDLAFDTLRDRGGRALLLFTPGEALRREFTRDGRFERFGRWPNVTVRLLDDAGDSHVLQSLSLQQAAHAATDAALQAELELIRGGAPAPALPVAD
jgi:alpha-beta hydrolase superfamily lysophospholipase